MQFTPQQLAGSHRYSHALVGNWHEDQCHNQRPISTGLLEKRAKKAERCLHQAPTTYTRDKVLRYGDCVQIQAVGAAPAAPATPAAPCDGSEVNGAAKASSTDSGGGWRKGGAFVLACDPFEEAVIGTKEYIVTAASAAAYPKPVARTVLRVLPVTEPKLKDARICRPYELEEQENDGSIVRYGDDVLLCCDDGLLVDERLGLLRPPLFLASAPKSETRATPVSGRQSVFLRGGVPAAMHVWRLQPTTHGKEGAIEREEADGKPVVVDEALVIVHRATMSALCCERRFSQTTDFGPELEVSCFNAVTTARTLQLGHERSGKRTAATAAKSELLANRWVLRAAANPSEAVETRKLPPPMDAASLLPVVINTIKARSGGVRDICRNFRVMAKGGTQLDRYQFAAGLRNQGVDLDDEPFEVLLRHFDCNGDGHVSLTEFVRTVRGPVSERRRAIVAQAFAALDTAGAGKVTVADVAQKYSTAELPAVREGRMTHRQAMAQFLAQWDTQERDGVVTKAEFDDYYQEVGATVGCDDEFELMVRNAWHLSGGEGTCENSSCLRVLVTHGDGSQEVVEVKNDLGLNRADRVAVREWLGRQGVRDVVSAEAAA